MTVTKGSVSKFNCSTDADTVSFRVNGTSVNVLDNPDIEVTISLPGMEPRLHILHIVAKEEYNNTRVQCIATSFLSGPTFSNEAVLIIQGKESFYFWLATIVLLPRVHMRSRGKAMPFCVCVFVCVCVRWQKNASSRVTKASYIVNEKQLA